MKNSTFKAAVMAAIFVFAGAAQAVPVISNPNAFIFEDFKSSNSGPESARASILMPDASILGGKDSLTGMVVADAWDSQPALHYDPDAALSWPSDIVAGRPISAGLEPSTILLVMAGCVVLGYRRGPRRASPRD